MCKQLTVAHAALYVGGLVMVYAVELLELHHTLIIYLDMNNNI